MDSKDEEILQVIAAIGAPAKPVQILGKLSEDGSRGWLNYRLKRLVEQGLVIHDRGASTYVVPAHEDLQSQIQVFLEHMPQLESAVAEHMMARGADAEAVQAALRRLRWDDAIEDIRGVARWKQLESPEVLLWLTPQAHTLRGTCYVCLDDLDGLVVVVADRRGSVGHGALAVHVQCRRPASRSVSCTACGLDLAPSEEAYVSSVNAWEIMECLTRRDWLMLAPLLHRIGEAVQKHGGSEGLPIGSERCMPTPDEVLLKAFPGRDMARGAPGDAATQAMLVDWCLIGLEKHEIAANLDATLAYFGAKDTGYPQPRATYIRQEAAKLHGARQARYWQAIDKLLGPAGAARHTTAPEWFHRSASQLRAGGTRGLDDPVFSRPLQSMAVYRNGHPYHPYCASQADAAPPQSQA